MNDWPEGWSGDNRGGGYGRGSASARPESARVMRQVRRGAPPPSGPGPSAPPHGAGVPQQPSYVDGQGHGGYDSGYNTGQVYGSPGGRGPDVVEGRGVGRAVRAYEGS
ncbi:LytR family transcriptional regulator, partial [Streptomyces geysiriensis]|nr:LytR family transcriptional regulator [Streptomyces geysiriensis]